MTEFGPLRDDPETPILETPIPNYMPLLGWVKLRLVRALAGEDAPRASAQVRQLALLIHSSGLLIGDAVAVSLLKLDFAVFLQVGVYVPQANVVP